MVLRFHPVEEFLGQRPLVAKFLSHVGKVHTSHEADLSPALSDRLFERAEKSGHPWILRWRGLVEHQVMKRGHENGDDVKVSFLAKHILEKQSLEFERVLGAVENFVGKEISAVVLLQRADKFSVGFHRTQRCVVVFLGGDEELTHAIVRGAEQDKEVGIAPLCQLLVRPGIARTTDSQIDVWGDDTAHRRVWLPVWGRQSRPFLSAEE